MNTESVELLAAVAEIDADQTPLCCLEIAQLVKLHHHHQNTNPKSVLVKLIYSLTFLFLFDIAVRPFAFMFERTMSFMCCVAEADWSVYFTDRRQFD